jgi:hypothetical protein
MGASMIAIINTPIVAAGLVALSGLVFIMAMRAWYCNKMCVVDRWYFMAIAFGSVPVQIFYILNLTQDVPYELNVAMSRIAWGVLFGSLAMVLQSICRNNKGK